MNIPSFLRFAFCLCVEAVIKSLIIWGAESKALAVMIAVVYWTRGGLLKFVGIAMIWLKIVC